ncbi:MAG: hypothetical protein HXY49_07205 [Ignavibacteriaceae bacterium]|nr:hypothetical protein [Ignavibacteriaceae bacterium]
MKNRIALLVSFIVLIFGFADQSFSQSDYEIVQNFKSQYKQIEQAIKDATSLNELNNISEKIDLLAQNFNTHRELLNKSLYPDNYDQSINKLNTAFNIRKGDFTTIDVLQTEVSGLKQQVDVLNKRNTELLNQIYVLEAESKKDKKRIADLEKTVADLRASLVKRDELIISMIDSLFPQMILDKSELTAEDKQQIFTEAEKNNVLYNIKKSIRDNVRFLEITSLQTEDINSVKRQQEDFSRLWRSVGTKIAEIYSEKGMREAEVKEIDGAFNTWSSMLSQEPWNSIRDEFAINGINLPRFTNGDSFVAVVSAFIDDELKNLGTKNKEESEKVFKSFADSTWFKSIQTKWIPYLVDNKLLTGEQKDKLDMRISDWKDKVFPTGLNWLYIVIIVLVIALVVLLFVKRSPKQKLPEPPQQQPTT